jgi:hypothetical protein
MCSLCHDAAKVKRFEVDHVQLRSSLPEIQAALQKIREALAAVKPARDREAAITAELARLEHDFDFLKKANDIHNMHYAAKLNQGLVERVSALCRELKVPEPKVTLPKVSETRQ